MQHAHTQARVAVGVLAGLAALACNSSERASRVSESGGGATQAVDSRNGASAGNASGNAGAVRSAQGGGSGAPLAGGGGGNDDAGRVGGGLPSGTPFVFVGSADGGLRAFTMDAADGSLQSAGALNTGDGLGFIALGPDDRTVFVSHASRVAAYAYDRVARSFNLLDEEPTGGGGTHVAVDPSGRYVFVAHYREGALSFLSYAEATGFGTAQLLQPGSNAHQARIGGSGAHVFVPCLGSDTVARYDLDPTSGALTAKADVLATGGPRHLDFHPTLPIAYVLTENSSQVHVYDVDPATGSLALRVTDSLFTREDALYHWSSDIHVSPNGRFLYATNRDPPEIVRFEIQGNGSLARLGADALGAAVREFAIDPAGRYLQVGGTDGNLVAYRIDRASGALTRATSEPGLGNIYATLIRYLKVP